MKKGVATRTREQEKNDKITMQSLLFIKNSKNEYDLNEILFRCVYDYLTYGSFALNIIWSKDRKYISEVGYINIDYVRKVPNKNQYLISQNFSDPVKHKPVLYQGFSRKNKEIDNQIFVF